MDLGSAKRSVACDTLEIRGDVLLHTRPLVASEAAIRHATRAKNEAYSPDNRGC